MFLTIAVRVTSNREQNLSVAVKQLVKVDGNYATLMGEARKLIEIIPLPPKLSVELSHVFADDNLPAHTHIVPKIIAEYLFNTSDEKNMVEIIKNMQEYDKSVRDKIRR